MRGRVTQRRHEHVHGSLQCHDYGTHSHDSSGCHAEDTEHGGGHDTASGRCAGRVPSHSHDGYGCHPTVTNHCHSGEHAHDGGGCHPIGTDACPLGEHEHLTEQTSGCHPTGRDHYSDDINITQETFDGFVAGAVCLAGGPWIALACSGGFAWFQAQNARDRQLALRALKKAHDELVDKKNLKDRPSNPNTPRQTTATTTPPTTTAAPTTTSEVPETVSGVDVTQAAMDREAGKITLQQYLALQNRWFCQLGLKRFCS